jgi:hypothetical protein
MDLKPYHLENFQNTVHQIQTEVDKLEKQVIEVQQYYASSGNVQGNNSKGSSGVKEKGRDKNFAGTKTLLQDASASGTENTAAKRMQELMRQFSTILRQITQHKWAWPFLEPVDVKGLGLHDYYEFIDKPMDFSTIKSKMEAKDGTGYKNVREIYADVRLIFKNAMKYNDEKHDVHVMAKTLMEKFEEKWLLMLPKVAEEEKRQTEEEAQAQLEIQHAQEMTYAKMAKDLSNELNEVDIRLRQLREMAIKNCRKLSAGEKKALATDIAKLSAENLMRALEIVSETNPNFRHTENEVELDFNAQSDYTLWRLKLFVKRALEGEQKNSGGTFGNHDADEKRNNSRKKREFCDDSAKNLSKTRKLSTL